MNAPYDPTGEAQSRKNLRNAGSAALWVWVLVVGLPIIVVIVCLLMCVLGSCVSAIQTVVNTPTS